jgi:hypothetical protein
MKGRRLADGVSADELQAGDYARCVDGVWRVRPPKNAHGKSYTGRLGERHHVEEHDDGTITVTPSILQQWGDGGTIWHGFLTRGVWRSC